MSETPPDSARRFGAPRGLNVALARLTTPLLRKRGAAFAEILARWPEIVGPVLAPDTQPERLVYAGNAGAAAILEIAVAGGQALELQHLAPLVCERINSFFGYRVVAGLRLHQMPIRRRRTVAPRLAEPRVLSPASRAQLAGLLQDVDDPRLRQALENLGKSLLGGR